MANPQGVDISHFQGEVDWSALKSGGLDFVAIKASQGTGYSQSSYYTENINKARAAGLIVGGYHFFTGTENGADQAKYFLQVAKPQAGDLLPMLDLEQSSGASGNEVASGALAWLKTVEEAIGQKPFIYTTKSFFAEIGNPSGFEDYPLWVAEYGVSTPKLPSGWSLHTIWQHSQSGQVSGISGDVDLDSFNGSSSTLDIFRVQR